MTRDGTIRGFDFHCHIDLHPDPAALIARCEQERVAVLAVTTTPRALPQNRLWMRDSSYVHAAVGLHPELVADRYAEIDLLEQRISECRLVGEVGLDGSAKHRGSYERQKEVFARALVTSQMHRGRVVTIHSRGAAADTISLIEKHTDPANVLCILHWFSGSLAEARRAADAGCYFSVNSAMLAHGRGRALAQNIPEDRLLTETDSPFLTLDDGAPGPLHAMRVVAELAKLFDEQRSAVGERVMSNALRVFRFAGINFG